jgi:hypothetical protein
MKGHSTKVQQIAEPVWLCPALSKPFIIKPKFRKKTNHLPHFIQKMKAALIKHRRQDHGSKRLLQGNAG